MQIPEIYFSVTSWKDILFHKKIIVDSLSIIRPFIDIDIHSTKPRQQRADFHTGDIVNYLQKALSYFNVHSFSLKDAAFRYTTVNSTVPLSGDHINLNVSNFSVVNNEDSHLLGSDKVSILLGKQRWILPDGKHEINFNRMTFDSKGQRFELDSFSFYQKATIGTAAIRLRADKFFFNSRHLPAIYQKEQLLLDTVICIDPVLSHTRVRQGRQHRTIPVQQYPVQTHQHRVRRRNQRRTDPAKQKRSLHQCSYPTRQPAHF